jgi:hypothetical protein
MIIAGLVIVIDAGQLPSALRCDSGFGWTVMVIGTAVLATAVLVPTRTTDRWYSRRSVRM